MRINPATMGYISAVIPPVNSSARLTLTGGITALIYPIVAGLILMYTEKFNYLHQKFQ